MASLPADVDCITTEWMTQNEHNRGSQRIWFPKLLNYIVSKICANSATDLSKDSSEDTINKICKDIATTYWPKVHQMVLANTCLPFKKAQFIEMILEELNSFGTENKNAGKVNLTQLVQYYENKCSNVTNRTLSSNSSTASLENRMIEKSRENKLRLQGVEPEVCLNEALKKVEDVFEQLETIKDNELARQAAEEERRKADAQRHTDLANYQQQKTAEFQRFLTEIMTELKENEAQRLIDENLRKMAEYQRKKDENLRQESETHRQVDERHRTEEEAFRKNAEISRREEEIRRQAVEAIRAAAESRRIEDDQSRRVEATKDRAQKAEDERRRSKMEEERRAEDAKRKDEEERRRRENEAKRAAEESRRHQWEDEIRRREEVAREREQNARDLENRNRCREVQANSGNPFVEFIKKINRCTIM